MSLSRPASMHPESAARLPSPSSDALEASDALSALIAEAIEAAGGWIGFDRYMQYVLYEPGLGYYSGGSTKFGAAGDFVTAPELSDALARAVVEALAEPLGALSKPSILELGAGNGTLAAQVLDAFDSRAASSSAGVVPSYRILETSADLRRRQQHALGRFGERVTWLDRLPEEPFDGLILANEVADALPTACFAKRGGRAVPLGVSLSSRGAAAGHADDSARDSTPDFASGLAPRFEWAEGAEQPALTQAVAGLEAELGAPLPDGYRSEIRLALPAWVEALCAAVRLGGVMLVDYGYERRDYYHPQRSNGTLMCHYRHRAHDDPFLYPGLQDVTAWVDFSACADAGRRAGASVAGYTTQAQFLIETLGANLVRPGAEPTPQQLSALKTLVLPGEMGERFKVLLLTKGFEASLAGRDLRGRLP